MKDELGQAVSACENGLTCGVFRYDMETLAIQGHKRMEMALDCGAEQDKKKDEERIQMNGKLVGLGEEAHESRGYECVQKERRQVKIARLQSEYWNSQI